MELTEREFQQHQPGTGEASETEGFYLSVARELLDVWQAADAPLRDVADIIKKSVAISLTGYYQDVVADGGLWHSFTDECRRMYGKPVPFQAEDESYMDYELNQAGVRFLTWYALAMYDLSRRDISPRNPQVIALADKFFSVLDSYYAEAPIPQEFRLVHELDMHDEADRKAIMELGRWLPEHSYLLAPALTLSGSELFNQMDGAAHPAEFARKLQDLSVEEPSGPIALYIGEWMHLMLKGSVPQVAAETPAQEHKYYAPFMQASGGSRILFFGDYEELNRFFIDSLGWEKGVNHLDQLRGHHDYTLLINREKGLLIGVDVARCIAAPGNKFYNADYARTHAFELVSLRGHCPADLTRFANAEGWLQEVRFPGDTAPLGSDEIDLTARCYLQEYYRD